MNDDYIDPLDALNQQPSEKPKKETKRTKRTFKNPMDAVNMQEAAKATGNTAVAGKMMTRSFRLPGEYLESLKKMAIELGVSQHAAERWAIARGLQAYFVDGESPEVEVVNIRRDLKLPPTGI